MRACRGCGAVQADKVCPACGDKYGCLRRGVEFAERGDHAQAMVYYQQALDLDPDFGAAHNNIGNLHNRRGHAPRALACFERASALAPDDAETRLNLAATRDLLDDPAVLADVEHALVAHPGTVEDLICDGNPWMRQQLDALIADCAARLADGEDARAHLVRGLALQILDDDDGARADLLRAVELAPADADALVAAASLEGDERALTQLERALAARPGHALALTRRADWHRLAGDETRAREDYLEALKCAPRDWPEIPELESWLEELKPPE